MRRSLSLELADIARELHGGSDIPQTLNTVLRHARTVAGCELVSITMATKHRFQVASSTDPAARDADRVQIDLDEGPALAALARDEPVVVDNIAADARWRRWVPAATDLGLKSALSVKLGGQGAILGALSLYAKKIGYFDDDQAMAVQLYAEHASVALESAHRISSLRQAIDDRNLIGQAQGILVERHGVDADQAFALLQVYSRRNELPLRDGAGTVVASLARSAT